MGWDSNSIRKLYGFYFLIPQTLGFWGSGIDGLEHAYVSMLAKKASPNIGVFEFLKLLEFLRQPPNSKLLHISPIL